MKSLVKRYLNKMIHRAYLIGVLIMLFITSCSSEKGQNSQVTAEAPNPATTDHNRQMHMPPIANESLTKTTPALTSAALPKELVCMVNNAYMGKKQVPVPFEDKLYYGCCQMCVKTIQNDRSVRVAFDPLTKKEVDKSGAFITLNPATRDGSVLYFESEENFQKYISL
jgi:hypothetical protein